ncbi:Major Facilitator Superfamily (MFS) [Phytophthora infestans T30-4]|uniref:Major Facilitator Superfamily (MFS) n=1 Tax=Phytophthora infestans (strain T30-4) TaxID=403677 RepID=D0NTH7_PHYIT|nr:Major Facilitator Superfamily (MFS) [Phytophthora infestans T30-4]EEY64928.1 Major Facilitator Superfamily (MFS) [Phytophthora infestans T30-4]|eukprot:XP_002897658.1 Major Facilitator Superfamily (MFS) [Phytophthora infestans T30-4]
MCAHEQKETLSSAPAKWYENCLWQPKLMYAIANVQQSSVAIFLAVYYQQNAGFSKLQIGVLQTLPCICAMVSPPIWGAVADYIRNQRAVHYFCIITGGLLMFCIQYFYWSYHWTLAVLMLANFQSMPAGFPHGPRCQRLFGAVGWGAGAYITGLAVAAAGISWAFNISIIFMFVSLLVLRTIPPVKHGHHDDTHSAVEEGGKNARQPSFADNMRRICEKKDVIMLLLVVFFMGLMYGVLSSFLALNLFNLSGGNAQIVGIAIMCETLSELPAFFFSHAIIQKFGTVKVLLVSIAAYALRVTYYAVMTNAWSAIPFEFLHGCTFSLAWAACTQYIYAAAPKGCEGTVMGLLNATQNGLARAVGTMVGGFFYQHYGARVMWTATDLGVPLALIFLSAFAYLKRDYEEVLSGEEIEKEESEMFSPHHHSKAITSSAPSYDEIE